MILKPLKAKSAEVRINSFITGMATDQTYIYRCMSNGHDPELLLEQVDGKSKVVKTIRISLPVSVAVTPIALCNAPAD